MAVLRQLIAPESGLRKLVFTSHGYIGETAFIPIMLDQSSLEELTILYPTYERIEHLPCKNTNLKKLLLSSQLIGSLGALLPNITSLTCLKITSAATDDLELNILFKTVDSLPTLQVLEIDFVTYCNRDGRPIGVPHSLLQLIEAAGNSRLKGLTIDANCFNLLPSDFKERYKHLHAEMCTEK